jgi:hypothetical protein
MLRKSAIFILLMLAPGWVTGQMADSAVRRTNDSRKAVEEKIEQTSRRAQSGVDSLLKVASVKRYTDSLKVLGWSDSLRRKVNGMFSPSVLTRKTDSLRSLNLPSERITHFSDSMLARQDHLLNEIGTKQMALQQRVAGKYDQWMKGARDKLNLDSAGLKAPALDTSIGDPLKGLGLATVNLPQTGLPDVPQPLASPAGIPEMPGLNTNDFASVGLSSDLTKVGGDLAIPSTEMLSGMDKTLPAMPDVMKEVNGKLGEVKALSQNPGEVAENAVGQLSEVSSAAKELEAANKLKDQNEALQLAGQMKDPNSAGEALQREAVNHFQGQQAALEGAMSQMSKYKKKYASLGSLSEIKKNDWLPKNGLKGVPFSERFRVGLHAGFKSLRDTVLIDFYPNASYRITGRVEAGVGAIYQLRVTTRDHITLSQSHPVYGFSTFAVVKTFKAIFLRFEVDGNSVPKGGTPEMPLYRDWRWSFHSGIQTNFKIGKRWTGNVQMLYNFERNLKDGFPERLAMRMGVQYRWGIKN